MRVLITTMTRLLVAGVALGLACGSSNQPAAQEADPGSIKRVARALHQAALAAEPATTALLRELANQVEGHLAGLDNRVKTEESLVRKISARLADPASQRTLDTVDIVDSLRYTVVVDDVPEGHYVRSANEILSALERRGVAVVRVKNYWPRGDNYSGVNVVLRNSDGFQWEIQLHTTASLGVRNDWYPSYTRLRDASIDIDERRRIFDAMSPPWDAVDIPAGVLEPHNLHATERLILYPRP